MDSIYLDNAATTFPKPIEVINAVNDCINCYVVNPRRGNNALIKMANEQLDLTRMALAQLLGANPEQLVFVPSATYGINIVLQGVPLRPGDALYISPFEHNAVVRSAEYLKNKKGIHMRVLPIERDCTLNIEETTRWFETNPPGIVAITHASNVSGDILPIKNVIDLTHQYGGKVLIDAAQTVGIHTPRLDLLNYDFVAFSSHKGLYGIPGSGGLLIKDRAEDLLPLIYGGTGLNSEDITMPLALPERFEAGTHALPAIISMLAGVQWLNKVGIESARSKVERLRQQLIDGLVSLGVKVISLSSTYGNTGIVAITIPNISPQEVNAVLDAEDFCVRSGLHCAPLAHQALGTFPNGTVRFSPAYFNTEEEICRLLNIIETICY